MTARLLSSVLLVSACIWSAACDEKLSTVAGPTPNLEPTFASIQNDIFQTSDSAGRSRCLGCHTSTGRAPAGGLNLNPDVAYDQLVNAVSARKPGAVRVIPGDPDNSYVVEKLEGAASIVGARMPINGPPFLTDGQIKIIRRWIAIGAPR
jgi:mono/diheme cytochrome c family protein